MNSIQILVMAFLIVLLGSYKTLKSYSGRILGGAILLVASIVLIIVTQGILTYALIISAIIACEVDIDDIKELLQNICMLRMVSEILLITLNGSIQNLDILIMVAVMCEIYIDKGVTNKLIHLGIFLSCVISVLEFKIYTPFILIAATVYIVKYMSNKKYIKNIE